MRPPTSWSALIVAVVALTACGGGGDSDTDFVPGSTAGLDKFDSYDYFQMLDGNMSLEDEGGEPSSVEDEDEWRALVQRQRELGLTELSEEERHDLLVGAAKAYLTFASSAEFEYESDRGTANARESYRADADGLLTHIDQRQADYDGIEVEFGSVVLGTDADVEEGRAFSNFVEGIYAASEFWTLAHDWECRAGDDGYDLLRGIRASRIGALLLDATPTGIVSIDGRTLEVLQHSRPDFPDAVYWLDSQTLWLIAWQEASGIPETGYVELRTQMTSINEPVMVEAPRDDCESFTALAQRPSRRRQTSDFPLPTSRPQPLLSFGRK